MAKTIHFQSPYFTRWQCHFSVRPTFPCRRNFNGFSINANNPYIKISEEVREAIARKRAVVALETTIYTHGFPHPENTALALKLESIVRANGGIPATIGILDGVARVGLSSDQLLELTASAGQPETRKVSRRDLAYILGLSDTNRRLHGGTTVSGTMLLARWAGIEVFATGGLGGVHRGGETSMDVSADLTELGRCKIAVISSGCKSFLDTPRTLEYLETQGVCVGTFSDDRKGQVDFPAFFTRDSGTLSPLSIQNEEEAAQIICAQLDTPLDSGILFANPIPVEHDIAKSEMDAVIHQALQDAKSLGSSGSGYTPFILKRIREITNGKSVRANRALVEANVARGTKVAVHLERIRSRQSHFKPTLGLYDNKNVSSHTVSSRAISDQEAGTSTLTPSHSPNKLIDVVIAGSLAIDLACDYIPGRNVKSSNQPQLHTSNPALVSQSLGGVGHNITNTLHLLGTSTRFCSIVGNDVAGATAMEMLAKRDLPQSGIRQTSTDSHTAQYVSINDAQKGLVVAMADMDILQNSHEDFDKVWKPHLEECRPKWLVIDANWGSDTLQKWLQAAKAFEAKVAYEPVSVAKAQRIFPSDVSNQSCPGTVPNHSIDLATPNSLELASLHEGADAAGAFNREDWWAIIDSIGLSSSGSRVKLVSLTKNSLVDQGIPQQSIRLLPFIPCILTTLGERGVLLTQLLEPGADRLTSPASAPYILSRSFDGSDVVGGVYMRLFEPVENVALEEILSVNGIGDTFLGVVIAGLAKENPRKIEDLIDIAQKGSVLTLKSKEAVNSDVSTLQAQLCQ